MEKKEEKLRERREEQREEKRKTETENVIAVVFGIAKLGMLYKSRYT